MGSAWGGSDWDTAGRGGGTKQRYEALVLEGAKDLELIQYLQHRSRSAKELYRRAREMGGLRRCHSCGER